MALATEVLMAEHRGIELMLNAMERNAPKIVAGDADQLPFFETAIDFLRNFADNCHHYKEERLLFPALAERGVPTLGGPIGIMLSEHEQGRAYIRAMAEAVSQGKGGQSDAYSRVASAATGYVALLRAHIQKEDTVLFPWAERVMTRDELTAMAEQFDVVELEVMGEGTHERYHRMLDNLE